MPKAKANGELLGDLPSWVPLDAWNGWLEVRKAKKTPNTERALRIALAKLDRLRLAGENVEAVIDQSTERGWTTFYPFRDTAAKPSASAEQRPVEKAAPKEPEARGVPIPADVREKMRGLIKGTRH